MFNTKELHKFKKYAEDCYPNEACAIIVNDKVIFKDNISENPTNEFKMSPLNVSEIVNLQCVLHSHCDDKFFAPSKSDMQSQIQNNCTWGMININNGVADKQFVFFGNGVAIPPLLSRPFRSGPSGSDGKGDCYALIKDWYKLEKQIDIPEFPRDAFYWEHGENLYMENFEKAGFYRISKNEIQPGDCFLGSIRSKVINHGGVYLGNGKILHQLFNYLSSTDIINRWEKVISLWVRYGGEKVD